MKTKELLLKIIDLCLQSDEDTADWVNVNYLRHTSYLLLLTLLILIVLILCARVPLRTILVRYEVATLIYRSISVLLLFVFALISFVLAGQYYRYVLSKAVPIRINNIAFILFLSIASFGTCYYFIYCLYENAFTYVNPPFQIQSTLMDATPEHFLMKLQFMVFSACQSLNAKYFKISSNSSLISILGLSQFLFTLITITLVVSSYVSQHVKPKLKN